MDYRLEVVAVPVSDVDEAKAFYERIGYHVDHDHRVSEGLRFVQITPPGSCCSIVIGNGITSAPPGSAQRLQVVVDDVEAAKARLRDAGVDVGDVEDSLAGRFVFFSDPDGNGWAVQQFPAHDLQRAPRTADGRRHPPATGDMIRLECPWPLRAAFSMHSRLPRTAGCPQTRRPATSCDAASSRPVATGSGR